MNLTKEEKIIIKKMQNGKVYSISHDRQLMLKLIKAGLITNDLYNYTITDYGKKIKLHPLFIIKLFS